MKKLIFCALVGASLFASCAKEEVSPKERTFSYEMSGRSMYTKSVQDEDVLTCINASLPSSLKLVLTSTETNKIYTTYTGEGVTLPSDTYKVLGSRGAEPICGSIISGASAYLTHTPSIDVDETVIVTDDKTDYLVHGKYGSFALVCDKELVEKALVTTMNGTEEIRFLEEGDSKVVFAQGNYSSVHLVVTLIPVDKERYKETTFNLSTMRKNGVGYVENGKYYVLEPTANGAQPKIIGLELPSFTRGEL